MNEYLLEMTDIVKNFPGVKALKGVELKIKPGEIHALVGENGAGKSTIMKCLMGIHQPTSGKIVFDGQERSRYSIQEAMAFGIAMIHQELNPVHERTIMSNMWLGREPRNKFGLVDWKMMYQDTKKYLEEINLIKDPKTLMKDLTVAQMQMVEIAKAVSCNAKLLIMDEPTASLTEREVNQLFSLMREFKKQSKSIIYISHKLDEIYQITDRISVFRDGEYIGSEDTEVLERDKMIEMMVGRTVSSIFPKEVCEIGDTVLEVQDLSHRKFFKNVSFQVHKGEIVGIAGLVGAGRTEVIETIFGIRNKTGGTVILKGKPVTIRNSQDAIKQGMALLTEERRRNGIFPVLNIRFNMTIANIRKYQNSMCLLNKKKMKEDCNDYIEKIQIKTPSDMQQIQFLSGGNQQKVLVGRWLLTDPDIIFLDEPTRGIDVGAKSEIHKLISMLAKMGKAVVMVSSELPEIMGMSDRIIVMREGKMTGILENDKLSQECLMEYFSGIRDDFRE